MTQALAGVVVVVTRPAGQAARFAALATAAGAEPLLLPTIEIEPIELDQDTRERLAPDGFDWTIYTSANAVEHSLRQLPRPTRTKVAAIGRATARALGNHGIVVDAVPHTTADSEGLLELECFADLRDRRVLVLKGRGGRPLLREELARRGADVVAADVYLRRRADADPQALAALREVTGAGRAVITVTSAEVLEALLGIAAGHGCSRLLDAPLLVPGNRVAEAARRYGWRGRITLASSAEDGAMAGALAQAWSGTGGTVGA